MESWSAYSGLEYSMFKPATPWRQAFFANVPLSGFIARTMGSHDGFRASHALADLLSRIQGKLDSMKTELNIVSEVRKHIKRVFSRLLPVILKLVRFQGA